MQCVRPAHPLVRYVAHVLIKVKNCQNLQNWIRVEAGALVDEILLISYRFYDFVETPIALHSARDILRAVPHATRGVTPYYLQRDVDEALECLDSILDKSVEDVQDEEAVKECAKDVMTFLCDRMGEISL